MRSSRKVLRDDGTPFKEYLRIFHLIELRPSSMAQRHLERRHLFRLLSFRLIILCIPFNAISLIYLIIFAPLIVLMTNEMTHADAMRVLMVLYIHPNICIFLLNNRWSKRRSCGFVEGCGLCSMGLFIR